jgi:colicin import membrane protein
VEPVPTPAEIKAQADIAIAKEKEKARLLKEKKLALEQEKKEREKLAKLEQEKKDKEKQDKLKKEQTDKQAKAKEEQQRKQDEKDKRQAEEERKAAVKRALGLAGTGGSGPVNSSGAATQSSGRSANYMGKIAGAIKANITYLDRDSVVGDPRVEVDITFGPSGTILSARMVKSSGLKSWDEAVMRAIEKTTSIPKDTDGTVPSMLPMAFRVKD